VICKDFTFFTAKCSSFDECSTLLCSSTELHLAVKNVKYIPFPYAVVVNAAFRL